MSKIINITNQSVPYQVKIIKALCLRVLQPIITIVMLLSMLSVLSYYTDDMRILSFAAGLGLFSMITILYIRHELIKDIERMINTGNMPYEFHFFDGILKVYRDDAVERYCLRILRRAYIINNQYLAIVLNDYRYILMNLETFVIGDRASLLRTILSYNIKLIRIRIPCPNQ